VGQNLVDDGALSDGGDDAGATATALAVQNVERKRTLEQLRPRHGAARCNWFWGCLASDVLVAAHGWHSSVSGNAHDVAAMFGIGGEQAEIRAGYNARKTPQRRFTRADAARARAWQCGG
jgi:hypothetical protein